MRVMLASPTYGTVDPMCRRALHAAIMTAANHGTSWMGDLSQDRMSYSATRNKAVEILMDDPSMADGIMWVDSDILPRADSIWRLLGMAEKKGFDFLSGVYHTRLGEHKPVFYSYNEERDGFTQCEMYEVGVVKREGGCGFGFVWTSLNMLQKMAKHPLFSLDRGSWFPDHQYSGHSEDLGFCRLAWKAGIPLYVDTGIQVGHMGDANFITRDNHLQVVEMKSRMRRVEAV